MRPALAALPLVPPLTLLAGCDDANVLPSALDNTNAVWEQQDNLFTDETIRADPDTGDETR